MKGYSSHQRSGIGTTPQDAVYPEPYFEQGLTPQQRMQLVYSKFSSLPYSTSDFVSLPQGGGPGWGTALCSSLLHSSHSVCSAVSCYANWQATFKTNSIHLNKCLVLFQKAHFTRKCSVSVYWSTNFKVEMATFYLKTHKLSYLH